VNEKNSKPAAWLACILCDATYTINAERYRCDCQGLLEVKRPREHFNASQIETFDQRKSDARSVLDQSGVWRFREAVLDTNENEIVSHPEGATRLYQRDSINHFAGLRKLYFKHEGENPTGSFKDRGMTVAVTQAMRMGKKTVACASTGNTSASLAAYAAQANLKSIVFVPDGQIANGKLAQTLAYGVRILKVRGDFDVAMKLVFEACRTLGIYLVNSINPFRIEGQKTIVWELLQDLKWHAPHWIALPGGNLGNTSAFGKAISEAYDAGWIARKPRLCVVQAHGANPFFRSYLNQFRNYEAVKAQTIASAIRIGNPVSFDKAKRAILETNGIVAEVTDEELMHAKRMIDSAGIGCEPASACSLAGVKKLRDQGVIEEHESVVCVLTGHLLKDADVLLSPPYNQVYETQIKTIEPTVSAVEQALANHD